MVKNIRSYLGTLGLLLIVSFTISANAWAEPQVAEFVAGLRERGLYELADEYGSEQWQRSDLSDRQRADLAIQLALLYTDWALASPPERRDALWAKAIAICEQVGKDWPTNRRRPLVDVQAALVSLARGELAREENIAASPGAVDAAAAEQLRFATRGLAEVSENVRERLVALRLRPSVATSADALTAHELESLELNIAFHLGRAHRQLGLCYPPQSSDRDNALLQAASRLTPLAQWMPADEIAWKSRLELVACLRELGRLPQAQEMLQTWLRENVPAGVGALLLAENVRLLIAAGQPLQAQETARQAIGKYNGIGELAIALVEAELAVWSQSRQSGHRPNGRELAELVNQIERQNGPYWGRRAQLVVGSMLTSANGDDVAHEDPATVLIAAKQLYATGRIDEAVAKYDVAAQRLEQQGKSDESFAAWMTAAAIEREAGHLAAAADRYRRLALKMPRHARAAEAHQFAVLCVAQQATGSGEAGWPAIAADYEQLLEEHLAKWPEAASSDAVRLWFGKLLAARADWPAAIQTLQLVRPDSADFSESVRILCKCYEHQLQQLANLKPDEAEQQRATRLVEATKQLQPLITGVDNRWPAQWSDLQRETALALARLHLQNSSTPSPYAERLLAALVRSEPAGEDGAAEEWHAAAQSLFIVALARNGKAPEARAIAANLGELPAALLLESVDQLDTLLVQRPGSGGGQLEIGQLALTIIRQLEARRAELDATSLVRMEMHRAGALAAAGHRPEALAHYKQLLVQSPDDGELHERYARLLTESDDIAQLRMALASWHMVERRSRRGGPRWLRARQARIDLLNRVGDRAEADKLLRLTRLLDPDWDRRGNP